MKRPSLRPVAIDCETTGLDPARDRVIQVGIAWRDGDRIKTREWTTNPGGQVLSRLRDSVAIHGITRKRLQGAPHPSEVSVDLRGALEDLRIGFDDVQLFAYNRPFDERFLERSPWKLHLYPWGSCLLEAMTDYTGRHRRLIDWIRDMHPDPAALISGAHGAGVDAAAALWVYEYMEEWNRVDGELDIQVIR